MNTVQIAKSKLLTQKNWATTYQKKNIDPKALGWIMPDGIINFQTVEAAENYAKNRCIAALNAANPFERGILVKDNKVIAEVDGECSSVDMSKYKKKMAGTSFFHGHVILKSNTTLPLSLKDYLTMLSERVKKIVAFDKNGKHSTLIQMPQENRLLRFLPIEWQEMLIRAKQIRIGKFVTSEFGKEYAKMFPKDLRKKMEILFHYDIGMPYGNKKKIDTYYNVLHDLSFEDRLEIECVSTFLKENGTYAMMISNFWKKISKKINCIYDTNWI